MAVTSVFNREMLTLARESRGLSQSELADGLGLSQSEISKMESGLREPDADQVRRIAHFLRYEEDFFFLNEPVRNFGTSCIYHRKRAATPERMLRQLLAMVNVCRIQIRRLLLAVDLETENRFLPFDVDDYAGDVEKIAEIIRSVWGIPPGPVQDLVREIEDAGGIVIRCDFGTSKVDAVSQWLPDLPPLFFVNRLIQTDRLRFTLAHEIGHIIMHRIPTDDMEREADRFAAEFLMPRREIKPQLDGISLPKLATLKQHWRVSMNALLKRACDLGTISPRSRSYLWMQMGKAGYRKIEPVTIPTEEPTTLDQIISTHSKELGYTTLDLSKLVFGLETALADNFVPNRYQLRIVG
jgi:Zn-dependent peptidase ImmA (M78 family)/transcriptional regulator with XRE-family HTH domain